MQGDDALELVLSDAYHYSNPASGGGAFPGEDDITYEWHYATEEIVTGDDYYDTQTPKTIVSPSQLGPVTIEATVTYPPDHPFNDTGYYGWGDRIDQVAYLNGAVLAKHPNSFGSEDLAECNFEAYRHDHVYFLDDGATPGLVPFYVVGHDVVKPGESGEAGAYIDPDSTVDQIRWHMRLRTPGGSSEPVVNIVYLDVDMYWGSNLNSIGDWFWKDGKPTENIDVRAYLPGVGAPAGAGRVASGHAQGALVSH